LSAIGDGPDSEFDQFPLYRHDKFDCVSFVALIFVLLHADNINTLHSLWQKLNYSAEINFLQRKHFMETSWLPGLEQLGWARAITDQSESRKIDLKIDIAAWLKKTAADKIRLQAASAGVVSDRVERLRNMSAEILPAAISLEYIAVQDCLRDNFASLQSLPEPCLVAFVNPDLNARDKLGTDLAITHCGFIVKSEQGLVLYHASATHKKVVAMDFVDYCTQRQASISGFGFCLFAIN
jgi:hypothetical protein